MHLSMLIPRVGGGGAQTQGNLTFSREPESNNPNPWAPRKFQIPTPRYRFFPKTGRSYVKFPTPGQNPNVKIPTQEKARGVNFPWVAHPSPPPHPGAFTMLQVGFNSVQGRSSSASYSTSGRRIKSRINSATTEN